MKDLKDTLQAFTQTSLHDAGLALFAFLGIRLKTSTAMRRPLEGILKTALPKGFTGNEDAYFLGTVDDNSFGLFQPENEGFEKAVERTAKGYKGIFLFAVQLNDDAKPTRTDLAALTRAFNRESKHVPVIVLIKYQKEGRQLLSLAATERSAYLQDWRSGEKVGKISLLKDIDLVNPHRGHRDILQGLKLNANVQDFNGLHKHWQEVFDIQTLNKRFYKELFTWFCWARRQVWFPDMAGVTDEKELDKRKSIHAIRLITRLLFTWFLKEKRLVPDAIFDKKELAKLLRFGGDEDTVYYKAILQNLFFATLNQEMNVPGKEPNRYFAIDKSFVENQEEHGVKSLYRYARLFNCNEAEAVKLFEKIPFLNGGLFDCLDKTKKESGVGKAVYIDGFSREKKWQAIVPDKFFFLEKSNAEIVDLSKEYGDKKHSADKAWGILEIFRGYKFTVEENTPLDEEVALDPELLGRVFENLLASYNPETGATARKATGSYYTPREIVDYMVNESLVQYLLQKAEAHFAKPAMPQNLFGEATRSQLTIADKHDWPEKERTQFEEQLRSLLNEPESLNPFDPTATRMLISALNNCRLLDPACGSGAFPMGALQRMVYLLGKLDPGNELWKQEQRERVIGQQVEALNNDKALLKGLSDAQIRQKAIGEVEQKLADIENSFNPSKNELDFARKLYLIENCLFGVDIQPIAVQIAKLRCFISLIIEQKVNDGEPNRGILPLPNLETKFVAADTLIALEKENFNLFQNSLQDLKAQLRALRHDYFTVKKRSDKSALQKKDEAIRKDIRAKLDEAIEEYCQGIEAKIAGHKKTIEMQQAEVKKIKAKPAQNAADNANLERMEKGIKQANSEVGKLEVKLLKRETYHLTAKQLSEWNPYNLNARAEWFDPEWMFDVREGFDLVIGNPPYFQIQKLKNEYKDSLAKQPLVTYSKSSDLYCLFYEKSVQLLQNSGILAFITSNSWLKTSYGKALREFFVDETTPLFVLNFEDSRLFQAAIVETNILISKRGLHKTTTWGAAIDKDAEKDTPLPDLIEQIKTPLSGLSGKEWIVGNDSFNELKLKIDAGKQQLGELVKIYRGITTGFNDAFFITSEERETIVNQDQSLESWIKKALGGRNLKKYQYQWDDLWLIVVKSGWTNENRGEIDALNFFKNSKGALYDFMKSKGEEKRGKGKGLFDRDDKGDYWWELRPCNYYEDFEGEKIVWSKLSDQGRFAYDDKKHYLNNTTLFLVGDKLKFLLAILNSKLSEWTFNIISTSTGMGTNEWINNKVEQLPIAAATPAEETAIETIVNYLLWLKQHPSGHELQASFFELLIDGMVYELYFKKSIHDAGRAVIEHLGELPPLTGGTEDEANISQVYERLSHPEHKVRNNLLFMKSVEEVRIIEGL